jgi:hypothetical protein
MSLLNWTIMIIGSAGILAAVIAVWDYVRHHRW